MPWKVEGKIGCHFPTRGQPNLDTDQIIFCPNGSTATSAAIQAVYYIPPGVTNITTADLPQYGIWRRYWEEQKKLLAGSQTVCIEFVPEQDTPLTSLAIFTDSSETSQVVNNGIIHESGLVVYLATADYIDPNTTEKYELQGKRRVMSDSSLQNVTLKKGLKYYIHWTNSNNTFKPAYFEDKAGNYLNWNHSSLQQKTAANLNGAKNYLGVVTDVSDWLAADEDDFMIADFGQGGISNSDAYIRNNVCNNAAVIGVTGETFPRSEKDKYLRMSAGTGFMYIGNNYTESSQLVFENYKIYTKNNTLDNTKYKGIKYTLDDLLKDLSVDDYAIYPGQWQDVIYKKKIDLEVDTDYTPTGDNNKTTCDVIKLSYNANGNKHVAVNGSWYYADRTGTVYQLKSGFTYDFNNDEGYNPANITSIDWLVQNCMYYMNTGANCPGLNYAYVQPGVNRWNGSSFDWISDYNDLADYLNITSMSDAVEEIYLNGSSTLVGQLSDLAKTHYDGHYISNTVRSQTVQTDKKYYLEVNGNEV